MSDESRCSICSSAEYVYLYSAHDNLKITDKKFDLVKCKCCGVSRILTPPDDQEMQKYYPLEYFSGEPVSDSPLNSRKKAILEDVVDKGRIFDFGCGDCSFLLSLDKRWDKYGFDKRLYVDEKIIKNNDIKFWSGTLNGVDIPDEFFDAITFWASLEHTLNPKELLEFSYSKLKRGGKIIILLQNIDSIQAKIFKQHWVHLDLPRHIYHFSTKTLEETLKKLDYKILKVIHYNPEYNIPGFSDSSRNFYNSRKSAGEVLNHIMEKSGISDTSGKKGFSKKILSNLVNYFFAYPLAFLEVIIRKGGIITTVAEK
jgi:ubiquinone/menaquinone biosynthesis C-methylase UbiE